MIFSTLIMSPTLSLAEKIELVLICGDNYKSTREAVDIFNQRHPEKNVHFTTVAKLVKKFKQTGSVDNNFKVPHDSPVVKNEENRFKVLLSVVENPQISVAKVHEDTSISATSIRRILKCNRFYPFRPKFIQVLKDRDYDARFDFCAWYQGMVEENRNFTKHVLFSDESTFTSNGVVCSQNCRWWADENPHFAIANKDQYKFKVNVWCGIWNCQIVGPFFFRENMNSQRYLHFLETKITDFLDGIPLADRAKIYFQQDGAPIHGTREVMGWLDQKFGQQWIGRNAPNHWPARSPDLSPLDFFLWGFLKNKVYRERPFRNVEHLEQCITNCANRISELMLRNVQKEMNVRTEKCMERDGGHVEI